MSDLSPRARALFDKAREAGAPTPAERERLYQKLEPMTGGPGPTTPPPAAGGAGAWVAGGIVVGLAVAGLVWHGVGDDAGRSPTRPKDTVVASDVALPPAVGVHPELPLGSGELPASSVAPASGTTARSPATGATGASDRPPGSPQPPRTSARAGATHDAAQRPGAASRRRADAERNAQATGNDLAAELALLQTAQRARHERRFDAALASLASHATRFPDGALAHEREVTRALVLCERGDLERGRILATRFAPSAWSGALRAACGAFTEQGAPPAPRPGEER